MLADPETDLSQNLLVLHSYASTGMASSPVLRGNGGFRVGEWVVRPSLNQLARAGAVTRLRPKVMDVLAFLAARPGEVVSKDEILEAVWAKQFLGDTALSRAVFELREVLGDDPQHPVYIETIPKRGYRLVAAVEPLADAPEDGRDRPPAAPARRSRAVAIAIGAALVALAGVLAVGRFVVSGRTQPRAEQRRIVVLPFENLGAHDDAYFAAGVTDELTGRLSSVPGVSVIARNSAEHLTGMRLGQTEIGRELGADFVLGGTVRWERSGGGPNRVRITPRLVRVADDTQVWAAVYDRVLEDIFSVQSEIARSVIGEIGLVVRVPASRSDGERPTANVEAYQAFLRGNYQASSIYRSEHDLRLGLRMYERAVELDPTFALAWGEIARVRAMLYHIGFDRGEPSRAEGQRALDRAIRLDARSARVRYDAGLFYYWCYRDYGRALAEFEASRRTGGDTADLRVAEGYLYRRKGEWDKAHASLAAAAELDPRGWTVFRELGITDLYARRYEDAERNLKQAIALAPDEPEPYGFLAETYWTWRGDVRSARATLAAMPRGLEARQTRWRFWQEAYSGDRQAALDRALTGAFDVIDDSEAWDSRSLLLARAYRFLGRTEDARREFETVRVEMERLIAERPEDFSLHSALGIALAGLGREADAIREGRRGVELVTLRQDLLSTPATILALGEIYTMVGEHELACAQLRAALAMPAVTSAARLRLDPTWASLRDRPCFAALSGMKSAGGARP